MIVVDVIDDGEAISYDECFAHHTDAEVIINTSPVGMFPKVDASPVDLTKFPKCEAVLDVVYNPVEIFLGTEIDDARIQEIYEDVKELI